MTDNSPERNSKHLQHVCARVIGFGSGQFDGGIPTEIPIDLVPFDLRSPNSEFLLVLDRGTSRYIAVERISE